jgi:hypothetical protein
MIHELVQQAGVLEIVGDVIRVRAGGVALEDLAIVENVDASMPRERQAESFKLVKELIDAEYDFKDRDAAREFFTRITGLYKNWNYAAPDSPEHGRYREEIRALAEQHRAGAQPA